MPEFTLNEKRIIVAILIAIMEADSIIDPREMEFLDGVINEFEMDEAALDSLDELDYKLLENSFRQFAPDKKERGIELFYGMANSDDVADSRELRIIEEMGA